MYTMNKKNKKKKKKKKRKKEKKKRKKKKKKKSSIIQISQSHMDSGHRCPAFWSSSIQSSGCCVF